MDNSRAADILKKAIILEKQGQSFYRSITDTTENKAIKKIFATMVKEEQSHEQTLKRQLEQLADKGSFSIDSLPENPEEFSGAVLTKEIAEEISGAGYEAAAISAAMTLEVRSVDFYTESSEAALDTDEKKFFNYLSNWESTHLKVLSSLNREILERALQDGIE